MQVTDRLTLLNGDCLAVMRDMPDASVDAVVCDPPYGLSAEPDMVEVMRHWMAGDDYVHTGSGFMGKSWDSFVPGPSVWREALRVLKPGGHLAAFFGTRTYDIGTLAIRLAGFEVRDQLAWAYGSGFPKSLDVSKAIDKAAGVEFGSKPASGVGFMGAEGPGGYNPTINQLYRVGDTTPEAAQWAGWGTALKPAWEPICLARKPLIGTVASNVLAHGTGGINIDGCRIDSNGEVTGWGGKGAGGNTWNEENNSLGKDGPPRPVVGRFPANLIHDGSDEVLAAFPVTTSGGGPKPGTARTQVNTYGDPTVSMSESYGPNTGSAARFFATFQQEQNDCTPKLANGADGNMPLPNEHVDSALSLAVGRSMPGLALTSLAWTVRSTNVTQTELNEIDAAVTIAIQIIGSGCSHEWRHERLSPSGNRVSVAAQRKQTDTIMTTISLLRSDGSAANATLATTQQNSELGARDLGLSTEAVARFMYAAKASRSDRQEGNDHPTVKPTPLMEWLARLITPPGGLVLDPFMGSGSTGKACHNEGFRFVGIERDPDYYAMAVARIWDHVS